MTTLIDEIARKKWNLKSQNVAWILQIFGASINFEATLKFELEDSINEDLILYVVEVNCVHVLEAPQVEVCEYDQSFAFNFTCT